MTRSSSFHQALNSSPKLFQIHNICIFSKCNCRSSSRFGALKGFGSVGRSSFLPLFVGEKEEEEEEEEEEEADSGLGRGRDRVRSLVQCGGEGGEIRPSAGEEGAQPGAGFDKRKRKLVLNSQTSPKLNK